MAGERVSMVLHDGNRVVARRPLKKDLQEKNLLDSTKASFETKTKQHELGEQVESIGGIKAEGDAGFQMYVALEKAGRVVQVGLPCITDESGNERFLDASNLKPGDLDHLLGNLPPDVEVLIVWRLDRGMTQDIVLTPGSLVSHIADSGADYSMLDKKQCISCGGGASGKLDLVVDLISVRLFGGETEDPIRMSTLMVLPPDSTSYDAMPPPPPPPSGGQAPVFMPRSGSEGTDFALRLSWADSITRPEEMIAAQIPQFETPVFASNDAHEPASEAVPETIILFIRTAEENIPMAPPNRPAREQPGLENPSPAPIFTNPSERNVWLAIHARGIWQPKEEVQTPACLIGMRNQPAARAPRAPGALSMMVRRIEPAKEQIIISQGHKPFRPGILHGLPPAPILRTPALRFEAPKQNITKKSAKPKTAVLTKAKKPFPRKMEKTIPASIRDDVPKRGAHAPKPPRKAKRGDALAPRAKKELGERPSKKEAGRKAQNALLPRPSGRTSKALKGKAKEKRAAAHALSGLLNPYWKRRGKKFRMKKKSAA